MNTNSNQSHQMTIRVYLDMPKAERPVVSYENRVVERVTGSFQKGMYTIVTTDARHANKPADTMLDIVSSELASLIEDLRKRTPEERKQIFEAWEYLESLKQQQGAQSGSAESRSGDEAEDDDAPPKKNETLKIGGYSYIDANEEEHLPTAMLIMVMLMRESVISDHENDHNSRTSRCGWYFEGVATICKILARADDYNMFLYAPLAS